MCISRRRRWKMKKKTKFGFNFSGLAGPISVGPSEPIFPFRKLYVLRLHSLRTMKPMHMTNFVCTDGSGYGRYCAWNCWNSPISIHLHLSICFRLLVIFPKWISDRVGRLWRKKKILQNRKPMKDMRKRNVDHNGPATNHLNLKFNGHRTRETHHNEIDQ